MKKFDKDQKGITLIALTITIIILLIISGISVGEISKRKNSVSESKEHIEFSNLQMIQQAILEKYIIFKQTGNNNILVGEPQTYNDAQSELTEISSTETLKAEESDEPQYKYYKLTRDDLNSIGLTKIDNEDMYIVNYSSGEVFNITKRKSVYNNPLYIYGKNSNSN